MLKVFSTKYSTTRSLGDAQASVSTFLNNNYDNQHAYDKPTQERLMSLHYQEYTKQPQKHSLTDHPRSIPPLIFGKKKRESMQESTQVSGTSITELSQYLNVTT